MVFFPSATHAAQPNPPPHERRMNTKKNTHTHVELRSRASSEPMHLEVKGRPQAINPPGDPITSPCNGLGYEEIMRALPFARAEGPSIAANVTQQRPTSPNARQEGEERNPTQTHTRPHRPVFRNMAGVGLLQHDSLSAEWRKTVGARSTSRCRQGHSILGRVQQSVRERYRERGACRTYITWVSWLIFRITNHEHKSLSNCHFLGRVRVS